MPTDILVAGWVPEPTRAAMAVRFCRREPSITRCSAHRNRHCCFWLVGQLQVPDQHMTRCQLAGGASGASSQRPLLRLLSSQRSARRRPMLGALLGGAEAACTRAPYSDGRDRRQLPLLSAGAWSVSALPPAATSAGHQSDGVHLALADHVRARVRQR